MKQYLGKPLFMLLLTIFSVLSFTSCKDDSDDPKTGDSALIGTWVADVYEDGVYMTFTLVLNKDGRGRAIFEDDYDRETENIKWKVRGNSLLSITFIDGEYEDTITSEYEVSKNGKTLYWEDYVFTKK